MWNWNSGSGMITNAAIVIIDLLLFYLVESAFSKQRQRSSLSFEIDIERIFTTASQSYETLNFETASDLQTCILQ